MNVMRVKATQKDLQHLLSRDPIPLEVALRISQEHSRAFLEEIEYGNSLLEDAGTYLGGRYALRRFIRAELSDEIVQKEIESNRLLLGRMCTLFPEFIGQMQITSPDRARIAFNIVFDACSDYKSILASGRQEANRNKLTRRIEKLQKHVAELSVLLEENDAAQPWEFELSYRNFLKRVHGEENETRPFWKLKRDICFLSWYLELSLHRARTRPSSLSVPNNHAKTHLVDTIYGLTLSEGHPQFVTTPGSDFAYLCSLMFEIATGEPDESLAGAINRFARSPERAEADQYALDYSEERDRARDEDNFYDLKNSGQGSEEKIADLLSQLSDQTLSAEARLIAICEIEEAVEALGSREGMHGPFIMWADQVKTDAGDELQRLEISLLKELHHDIHVGKKRRFKL